MEEEGKLPLKRVEHSLIKFNEVAIPHHLDLLRQHKANIIKLEAAGEAARARSELRLARREAARLRVLLAELDTLRARLAPLDRARFDALTQQARDSTRSAVQDYLGSAPLEMRGRAGASESESVASGESVGVVSLGEQLQLRVDEEELALRQREELLVGWSELHEELRALQHVWERAHDLAAAHAEPVARVQEHVESAQGHVGAARAHLAAAERLRARAVLGAGGACVGALVGGPLGLCVGAKAGALAAAAGSLLGFVAARLLASPPSPSPSPSPGPPPPEHDKDQ